MPLLLAIESSCDETAAAVLRGRAVLSNVISSQLEHAAHGGVIPELASRLHQQQIVPVVRQALHQAAVAPAELDAVAVTQGPGLLGALLVGHAFAKAYAWALGKPLVEVNHMQAHVLANFLFPDPGHLPQFPLLCLTVSGGHTQIVLARGHLDMEIVGHTLDDAAGEAFDKAAKLLGLAYPGGPVVDRLAQAGNPAAFAFPPPSAQGLNFSFSGIKTALRYLVRDRAAAEPDFAHRHAADLCASYQAQIVHTLLAKLAAAAEHFGARDVAIAGGVAANSELRRRFADLCAARGWRAFIPPKSYCTDNAAMIGIAAHYRLLAGQLASLDAAPYTRDDTPGA